MHEQYCERPQNDDGPFLFISPLPFPFPEHITSNIFYMYFYSHILPCFEKSNCCRIRLTEAETKAVLPVEIWVPRRRWRCHRRGAGHHSKR